MYAAADLPLPAPVTPGMVRDILILEDRLTFEQRQSYDRRRTESMKQLKLTAEQRRDLIEYLKSI